MAVTMDGSDLFNNLVTLLLSFTWFTVLPLISVTAKSCIVHGVSDAHSVVVFRIESISAYQHAGPPLVWLQLFLGSHAAGANTRFPCADA